MVRTSIANVANVVVVVTTMEILLLFRPLCIVHEGRYTCLRTHISARTTARGDIPKYVRTHRGGRGETEGKGERGIGWEEEGSQRTRRDQCTVRVHRPAECSCASSMHLRMQPEHRFILVNPFFLPSTSVAPFFHPFCVSIPPLSLFLSFSPLPARTALDSLSS